MAWPWFLAVSLAFGGVSALAQLRYQQEGCAVWNGLMSMIALIIACCSAAAVVVRP